MPTERKRPLYVVLALLAALVLGTTGASSAWTLIVRYREGLGPAEAGQFVSDEADRAAVVARSDAYLRVLDAARPRGWPIAVAMLILGTGVLVTSVRTLGGRPGARPVLLQLVVAQAALGALSYWLLADVGEAELRWDAAVHAADVHERLPEQQQHEYAEEVVRLGVKLIRLRPRVELTLGTITSLFVVLALTRRRAREFFDASSEAFGRR
jgi:hypothetical protein